MEVFVIKALEKLRAESSRRDTEFRESCDAVIQRIQENSQRPNRPPDDGDSDRYWMPFQLACDAKIASKMKAMALDSIEKMIAFGYLRGVAKVKPAAGGAERPLMDNVVEAICSCRDDQADAVQLQLVKALNTAVGSTNISVHEGSLLLAVRAVYHVCLGSRNAVNRNTAKATLRQMLAIVFVRMEKWHKENLGSTAQQDKASEVADPAPAAAPPGPVPAPPLAPPVMVKVKRTVKKVRMEVRTRTETRSEVPPPSSFWPNMYPEAVIALGLSLVPVVTTLEVTEEVPVEYEEEEEVEVLQAAPEATPKKAAAPATPARGRSLSHEEGGDVLSTLGGLPSQCHRDAYLVFRSLCRLTAMAEEEAPLLPAGGGILAALGGGRAAAPAGNERVMVLSDEALLANPVALQSKLLSLDLVVGLLESAGPALQNGPKFIATIKTYLCVGLLKNFVSTIPALSSLSLKAFISLVRGFKRHVAPEVEVFISTIFLRILTSSTASHEQKLSVLTAFRSMVADPGSVLEMFLNYDCAEGRQNLFEDSIRTLSGMSQGPGKAGEAVAAMNFAAQQAAAAAAAAAAAGGGEPSGNYAPAAAKLPPGLEAGAIKAAAMQALASVMQSVVVLADAAAKQIADAEGRSIIDTTAAADAVATVKGKGGKAGGSKEKEEKEADDDDMEMEEALMVAAVGSTSGAGAGPLSPAGASAAPSASASLARSYDEQKKKRALLAKAAVKFAMKPKKGVEFMQTHGLCGPTPADIAACFHEFTDALDKTAMGEYMGEGDDRNIAVMHAFVDQLDFVGLTFDDGIRRFLAGFRLPGEAQKIDRMMEKFAERFCKNNPGVFPTADTAFILSYSIIMLHTDAHNPNIKPEKKMSKDSFLRNNRGIANGADLPAEFLGAIYESIQSRPFTLREDDALREKKVVSSGIDERTKREMQLRERADIVAAGTAQLSSLSTARRNLVTEGEGGALAGLSLSTYVSAFDVQLADHVTPMFEIVWGPLFATWSVNFEHASDAPEDGWTVNVCLSGFNQAIHVAGALRLETEKETLVASLCKFTGLALGEATAGSVGGGPGCIKELRGKNVAAVRALLAMAFHDGNAMGTSWGPVLSVVSAVARMQNVAMGGKEDDAFFPPAESRQVGVVGANTTAARREAERLQKLFEKDFMTDRANAALLAAHVPEADVSRLFLRSHALSSSAIVDFVTQLGAVSLFELASCVPIPPEYPAIGKSDSSVTGAGATQGLMKPRIFSLQKVVEVADFNMTVRPRMAWARMWDAMSRYFTAVCCSSITQVAMYAIDSLKQLSLKFCAKPELKSFTFQTKFLQPFASIMEATSPQALTASKGQKGSKVSGNPQIRELVLHVCANIIRARAANIRSGWRSFLAVYSAAASDTDEMLVSHAFSMAHEVVDTHFAAVVAAGAFTDTVKCMVAFGSNQHPLFSLRAIDHLATLGALLARGKVPLDWESAERSAESGAALADEAGSFYDLDGQENVDVVDDSRDRNMHAKLDKDLSRAGARAYSLDNFDGGEADGHDSRAQSQGADTEGADADPETNAEASAAEDAMDAAMLAADAQPGGRIRRFNDSTPHLQLWFPVLTGLARLISTDARLPVRMRSLHALFALLRRYGPGFDANLWAIIYSGVLMPVFDDVFHVLQDGDGEAVACLGRPASGSPRAGTTDMEGADTVAHYSLADFATRAIPAPALSGARSTSALANYWPSMRTAHSHTALDEHEWLRTTCMPALSSLVRLQARFFTRLSFLLPGLLRLIQRCVDGEIEGLARVGVASLRMLLSESGPRFNSTSWDVVTDALKVMFAATTPVALLECRSLLLGEGADDGLADEEDGAEGDDSGERADSPAKAVQVVEEAEPEHPSVAVWLSPASLLPVQVSTAYGVGMLEHVPASLEGEGVARVQLAYGTVYVHLPSHVAALRAALATAEPVVPVPAPVPVAALVPVHAPVPLRPVGLPFNTTRVVTQCVVQLELIGAVGVLTDAQLSSLSLHHVESLLGLLQGSAAFARKFNADRLLRRALWEAGFMRFAKHSKLPSLLRQETAATGQLLALLLRLYSYEGSPDASTRQESGAPWTALAISFLRTLIKGILSRYNQLAVDVQRAQVLALPPYMHASLQFTASGGTSWGGYTPDRDALMTGEHSRDLFREAAAYGPMVLQLLDGVLSFSPAQFNTNLHWLYPLLTGLIGCGSVEIRQRLGTVFAVRLRKLLPAELLEEKEAPIAEQAQSAAPAPEPSQMDVQASGSRKTPRKGKVHV